MQAYIISNRALRLLHVEKVLSSQASTQLLQSRRIELCALFLNPETQRPFPPTAQIAEAQAKVAAKNLKALIKNSQKEKFVYNSKGQMAIIGKRSGIATFLGVNISGFWAWLIWRNVYLSKIPTFDKKIRVFLDWAIDLFFDRDISRLKIMKRETEKEYKLLDEVDDVW